MPNYYADWISTRPHERHHRMAGDDGTQCRHQSILSLAGLPGHQPARQITELARSEEQRACFHWVSRSATSRDTPEVQRCRKRAGSV